MGQFLTGHFKKSKKNHLVFHVLFCIIWVLKHILNTFFFSYIFWNVCINLHGNMVDTDEKKVDGVHALRWGKFGQWNFIIKFIGRIIFKHLYHHPVFFFVKKKSAYTVLKMKWPIDGANMANNLKSPFSLRNNCLEKWKSYWTASNCQNCHYKD